MTRSRKRIDDDDPKISLQQWVKEECELIRDFFLYAKGEPGLNMAQKTKKDWVEAITIFSIFHSNKVNGLSSIEVANFSSSDLREIVKDGK